MAFMDPETVQFAWEAAELVFGEVFVLIVRLGLLWRRRRRFRIDPV